MTTTSATTVSSAAPKKSRSKKVTATAEPAVSVSPCAQDAEVDDSTKRGRKPRGGKILVKPPSAEPTPAPVANVILHLKCNMADLVDYNNKLSKIITDPLEYNPNIPVEIVSYNQSNDFFAFERLDAAAAVTTEHQAEPTPTPTNTKMPSSGTVCSSCASAITDNVNAVNDTPDFEDPTLDQVNMKDVSLKLKQLKVQLYKNALHSDKKSACFWCTCDYDNTTCYIPKYEMDGSIHGYGAFCRPECAVAHLMKENIDDSTKFERYHLLNQIYGKVYGYKKNIKPAADPHYLLDKFYGNLTPQEYRKLLKTEHLLLVLDKPLTRILPELHEDNEDLIMGIYGINKTTSTPGSYKVKRQSEKQQGPSINTILMNNFGI
jgi:hypothetical protein